MKINLGDKIYIIYKYESWCLTNPVEDGGFHLFISEVIEINPKYLELCPIIGDVYKIGVIYDDLKFLDLFHHKEFLVEWWFTTDEYIATTLYKKLLDDSENKQNN